MSERIKIYRLKSAFEASIPIILKSGKKRYVRFMGGSRTAQIRGFFATASSDLQQALESDVCFGRVYTLESTLERNAQAPQEVESPQVSVESYLKDPETAIHDSSVNSKKMARAYIQAEFGATLPADPVTVDELKKYAAQNFNVVFDKWN